MITIREQILEAIKKNIKGTFACEDRIYRSRLEALTRDVMPAISIEPLSDSAEQTTIPRIDWSLVVRIIIFQKGDVPEKEADPIIEDMHRKLFRDLTLGGLTMDIQPVSVTWNIVSADGNASEIFCEYKVLYKTALTNLSAVN